MDVWTDFSKYAVNPLLSRATPAESAIVAVHTLWTTMDGPLTAVHTCGRPWTADLRSKVSAIPPSIVRLEKINKVGSLSVCHLAFACLQLGHDTFVGVILQNECLWALHRAEVSGPLVPEACLGTRASRELRPECESARAVVGGWARTAARQWLPAFRDPCFPSESGPLLPEIPRCAFVHALLILQLDIITKYK
jgi:hypothetical protein